jgi:hypothetical protein
VPDHHTIAPEAEFTLLKRQLVGLKRRTSVRYRCALATLGHIHFPDTGERSETWIANLSEGGIGLNTSAPLEAGTALVISLKGPNQSNTVTLLSRVVHSTKETDGSWRVGCEFTSKLQPEMLDDLL